MSNPKELEDDLKKIVIQMSDYLNKDKPMPEVKLLTLDEILNNCMHELKVYVDCYSCEGRGYWEASPNSFYASQGHSQKFECNMCQGVGRVQTVR